MGFYAVSLLTLLSMTVLIGLLIVLIIVGTRVGAAAFLKRPLVSLGRQAGLIARSLNLRRGPEYAVQLHPEQAPGLFALIETAALQAGVQMPDRILLEMTDNAWVQLRGYRAGRGRCTLGVGYDLLALLTQAELMAVLTHEMAHARLVQRGYTGWLSNGLARLIQFARTLDDLDAPKRRGRLHPARMLDQVVTALGKSGARAMAMLSRQDEFAADALAARLCGPETYARTLTKLIVSGRKGRNLTWRDRLVQWQREGTITDWIRRTLQPTDAAERAALEAEALDPDRRSEWSTHPALTDRLAALPTTGEASSICLDGADTPALELLADPDGTAAALIVELERLAEREEQKDSQRLHRAIRKERPRRKHTPGEYIGMALISVGALGILLALVMGATTITDPSREAVRAMLVAVGEVMAGAAGLIVLGILLGRIWRLRERILLPAPAFAEWESALSDRDLTPTGIAALDRRRHEQASILLAQKPASVTGRGETARYWARQAYDALGICDYARAEAAAHLCLETQPKSLEGRIALGVSAAFAENGTLLSQTLGAAVLDWGLSPSLSWALGWALTMLGKWERAEAYLHDAVTHRDGPGAATIRALLAVCQWQQGKMREATDNARRATVGQPSASAYHVLLIRILVAAGRPQDAARELAGFESAGPARSERAGLAAVSVHLLLGHEPEAARCAQQIEEDTPGTKTLLRLASAYSEADRPESARSYLERVAALGFHPQVLVSLARIAHRRGDEPAARTHLLAALDMTRLPAPEADAPMTVLPIVLQGLQAMNGPDVACEEWNADISLADDATPRPAGPTHLALQMAAPSLREAKQYAAELYAALRPGRLLEDASVEWKQGTSRPADGKPISPGVYDCRFS
jgi:Zn-dependent protease with chaperone function/tetratricopeptide (TPR) repeat protein